MSPKVNSNEGSLLPNLLIRASAGSGKTYGLALRYLEILLKGIGPEEILATTFTNKAAGEILERVFSLLIKAAQSESEASEISSQLNRKFTSAHAAELLSQLSIKQQLIRICTLDSFFSALGRCFPWELHVPQNWSLLSEDQQHQLRQQVLAGMLHEQYELMSTALRAVTRVDASRSVYQRFEDFLIKGIEVLNQSSLDVWGALPEAKAIGASQLEQALATIAEAKPVLKNDGQPRKHWLNALPKLTAISKTGRWSEFFALTIVSNALSNNPRFDSCPIEDSLLEAIRLVAQHAIAELKKDLCIRTKGIANLLESFRNKYEPALEKAGLLGFNDLKLKLASAVALQDLSAVYFRLDARIKHLLLDEFQDTSVFEWLVLAPLAEEIMSKSSGVLDSTESASFYCVGDGKQAIYAWRGGEADILNHIADSWSERLEQRPLSKSWRSEPLVLAFVDKIFAGINDDPVLGNRYPRALNKWFENYQEHSAAKKSDGLACVRVELVDDEGEQEVDPVFFKAAEQVRSLVQANEKLSIAVLCRSNRGVAAMLEILRRPDFGIQASEESSISLLANEAVALVCLALRFAFAPENRCDAFQLAISPLGSYLGINKFGSVSDELRTAKALRNRISTFGIGSFIQELAEAVNPFCSPHDWEQLAILIQFAQSCTAEQSLSATDFLAKAAAIKFESVGKSFVRVMTIHKSKGLEFDAVILPDLKDDISKSNQHFLVKQESWSKPASLVLYKPSRVLIEHEPEIAEVDRMITNNQVMEGLSLLYVALTRARRGIYAYLPAESKSDSDGRRRISAAELIGRALELSSNQPVFEEGLSDWAEEIATREITRAQAASEPAVTFKFARKSDRPSRYIHVKPSDFEGGGNRELKNLFRSAGIYSYGTAVHRLLESIDWLTEEALGDFQRFAAEVNITKYLNADELSQFRDKFEIYKPVLRKVFKQNEFSKKFGDPVKLLREVPFVTVVEEKLVNGKIDRLVLFKESSLFHGAVVIDFKTDLISAATLNEKLRFYEPQMELYRVGAASLLGLEDSQIRSELVFLESGDPL